MPTVALVSFRLGGGDGVSVEAAKWAGALETLGWTVMTVAGSGRADRLVPGLGLPDAAGALPEPPTRRELDDVLAPADLVVVENLCSLPLNPPAADALGAACAGRPAILHHHDLASQRDHLAHRGPPPDDAAWAHVTINELSRRALGAVGIDATVVYNCFDPSPPSGDRTGVRARLGVGDGERLVLQPTRALARKNVGAGLAAAAALGATFWLLGPAEDGFGPELDRLVAAARCPVVLGLEPATGAGGAPVTIDDAYAACDVVALPSTWEGFGNPSVESATHDRPLLVGPYPVARELAAFGFEWFALDQVPALGRWLASGDRGLLERNHEVARRAFNVADLPGRLAPILGTVGFPYPRTK